MSYQQKGNSINWRNRKMMILFLALIFGIIVAALLVFSILRNRKAGKSKIVNILKLIILAEAIAYIVVFIIVIIKTMAA